MALTALRWPLSSPDPISLSNATQPQRVASALSASNVSENKASASLLAPSPVDGVDDVPGEEEQTVGLEGCLAPVWPESGCPRFGFERTDYES